MAISGNQWSSVAITPNLLRCFIQRHSMASLGGGGGEREAGRTCTDHGDVERLSGGLVGEQLRLVPDDDGRNQWHSVALDEH